ncbi:MAG: hypothetical protein J3K34DRAFT_32106 [Monoraphidium minutum]|nr:MAG: hypothetical protein J3K34DRAFT_32106 [Monoraphidium minutum]
MAAARRLRGDGRLLHTGGPERPAAQHCGSRRVEYHDRRARPRQTRLGTRPRNPCDLATCVTGVCTSSFGARAARRGAPGGNGWGGGTGAARACAAAGQGDERRPCLGGPCLTLCKGAGGSRRGGGSHKPVPSTMRRDKQPRGAPGLPRHAQRRARAARPNFEMKLLQRPFWSRAFKYRFGFLARGAGWQVGRVGGSAWWGPEGRQRVCSAARAAMGGAPW